MPSIELDAQWSGWLPAEPASAGLARRAVSDALSSWGLQAHADAATLLVSEVVTNAILHAGTELELRLRAVGRRLRVEVADGSALRPAARRYDDDASTGRGLELIELLAARWGAEPTAVGKFVWFELDDEAGDERAGDDRPGHGSTFQLEGPAPIGTGRRATVHLLDMSPALVHVTIEYGDAVLRELVLLSGSGDLDDVAPVNRTPTFDVGPVLEPVLAALAKGSARLDADVDLTVDAAREATDRLALIDEADRLAREGRLLTPPAVPEIGACGRWLYGQITLQLMGDPPTPWRMPEATGPERSWTPLTPAGRAHVDQVRGAVVVADEFNHIVHVNAAAAELLGWDADELTGRRLVTIIPAELREAHLAGFMRYQLTGEGRLLGRPIAVPALRQDGSRIDIKMTLTRLPVETGDRAFQAVFRQA